MAEAVAGYHVMGHDWINYIQEVNAYMGNGHDYPQTTREQAKRLVGILLQGNGPAPPKIRMALYCAVQNGDLVMFNELISIDWVMKEELNCMPFGYSLLSLCMEMQCYCSEEKQKHPNYNVIPKFLISHPGYRHVGHKLGTMNMLQLAGINGNLEIFKILYQHPEIDIDHKQGYSNHQRMVADLAKLYAQHHIIDWLNSPEAVEMKLNKMSLKK